MVFNGQKRSAMVLSAKTNNCIYCIYYGLDYIIGKPVQKISGLDPEVNRKGRLLSQGIDSVLFPSQCFLSGEGYAHNAPL